MGTFINIGNAGFQSARNSEYLDKSPLISVVNSTLSTERRFSCVTRCRRFGKSMAAKMLFTKDEVKTLADKHNIDFTELEKWYDGYQLVGQTKRIYRPSTTCRHQL